MAMVEQQIMNACIVSDELTDFFHKERKIGNTRIHY